MVPMFFGVVPFGLLAGVVAGDAGFGLLGALAFSIGIFAGASQLAAIDLLARGAPLAVVVGTVVVINLRMLMYGASLAPWWQGLARWQRMGAAYVLTDQAFALSVARYEQADDLTPRARLAFYLGGAVPMWLLWNVTTTVGVLVGDALPEDLPLTFALPLMFLALLVPAVKDRPTAAAALASGIVAVVARPLPANLGMPLAAATGIAVGTLVAHRLGTVNGAAPAEEPDAPGAVVADPEARP